MLVRSLVAIITDRPIAGRRASAERSSCRVEEAGARIPVPARIS
jgi:hypothetical protein